MKPRRVVPKVEHRALTQEEILAEAARTELDNLRDLEQMVAIEEATKQKALYKRSKYSGPMIRYHSKQVDGAALVSLTDDATKEHVTGHWGRVSEGVLGHSVPLLCQIMHALSSDSTNTSIAGDAYV